MKLGEIVVHMDNYNFTNFHQNQMKNKKVLLIACFPVQIFKVSVELRKSYIVRHYTLINIFGNHRVEFGIPKINRQNEEMPATLLSNEFVFLIAHFHL